MGGWHSILRLGWPYQGGGEKGAPEQGLLDQRQEQVLAASEWRKTDCGAEGRRTDWTTGKTSAPTLPNTPNHVVGSHSELILS